MDFDWITVKQAAESWGVSDRRVQYLCVNGKLPGAVRLDMGWLIPKNAQKPLDGRTRNGRKPTKRKQENG